MLSCIADSSPLRLAHGVQSLLVSTTSAVLMCMRARNRDESSHSSARTWAMSFHTSPRCNNGIHIHIHSERFALYYILFSNDVFRLNGGISRFETFHVMEDQSTCVELPICRGMSVLQDLNASSIAWSSVQSCWISCSVLPRLPMAMRMVYMPFSLVCERKKRRSSAAVAPEWATHGEGCLEQSAPGRGSGLSARGSLPSIRADQSAMCAINRHLLDDRVSL